MGVGEGVAQGEAWVDEGVAQGEAWVGAARWGVLWGVRQDAE